MSEKYEKIMDHVVVTEEMRDRILRNVSSAEVQPAGKVIRFPHWRFYAVSAACFVVLLVCALTAPVILHPAQETPSVDAQGDQAIVECQSAEELSNELGFQISDISTLPFEVANAAYISSWGEIGEIEYTGTCGQTATYRKSVGTDDNSGNYDTFSDTEQISVGTVSATIKGDGKQFRFAFWTDGKYAYSLVLSDGVNADDWSAIIKGVS